MIKIKYNYLIIFLLFFLILSTGFNSLSQEREDYNKRNLTTNSNDSVRPKLNHHHLGLALGMYIPGSQSSLSPDIRKVIPAFDFQYAYWIDPSLGFGLKSCFQSKHYSDPIVDNNDIEKELLITLSLLINIKVIGELNLLAGPGIEFDSGNNYECFSLGLQYYFPLGKEWNLAPQLLYEYKNSNANFYGGGLCNLKRFGY